MSNILSEAGASSIFWLVLAIVLIVAVVGYIVARRAGMSSSPVEHEGRVIHDWMPTGRIDFAGPSMDASAADAPASFYLQAEDVRFLISFSGIERKELRWRKATLNEAKRVVTVFHRQVEKKVDSSTEEKPATAVSVEDNGGDIAKKEYVEQ
jgi:hypothetical protein